MAIKGRRLRSWLHVADHPSWHEKPYYSHPLAHALGRAYRQLHFARELPDPYYATFAALAPFRDRLVCHEQRLNLEYALALAYTGDNSAPEALFCLFSAWDIAERLRDWAAQAEMGYLEGTLWFMAGQLLESYEAYVGALEALQRVMRDDVPADPVFELDLNLRVAGCAWDLGWFPVCLRHLDEARRIRALWAPDAAEEAASLVWLDALLARVRGQPVLALQQAAAAADLLLRYGRRINRGRAHTVLAESALEAYELARDPQSSPNVWVPGAEAIAQASISPTSLLTQARQAAGIALETAHEVRDDIGAILAKLALRRVSRLARRGSEDGTGVAATEKLVATARRLGDPALLGRAEVALADELLASGRSEAARSMYSNATRRFEEHYHGGLAVWPRRALQRLDEAGS